MDVKTPLPQGSVPRPPHSRKGNSVSWVTNKPPPRPGVALLLAIGMPVTYTTLVPCLADHVRHADWRHRENHDYIVSVLGDPPRGKIAIVGVLCLSGVISTWSIAFNMLWSDAHTHNHTTTHPHTLVGIFHVVLVPLEMGRGPGAPAPGRATGARLAQDPPTPPCFKKISREILTCKRTGSCGPDQSDKK